MNLTQIFTVITLVAVASTSVASDSWFTPAHNHVHDYFGTLSQAAAVSIEIVDGEPVAPEGLSVFIAPLCLNLLPVIATTVPPVIVRDDDTETGVGGACFPYETTWDTLGTPRWNGDDAGKRLQIVSVEATNTKPIWLACVDVNGDDHCDQDPASGDEFDLCWTGKSGSGGYSLLRDGPCVVYSNPAAINRNIIVAYLGGVTVEDGTFHADAAVRGRVYLAHPHE